MQNYKEMDYDSAIKAFEIGDDYIIVEFKSERKRFYKYTESIAGRANILKMKELANNHLGLNSFINEEKVQDTMTSNYLSSLR